MKILILTKGDFYPAAEIHGLLQEKGHEVYLTCSELADSTQFSSRYDLGISVHYQYILKQEHIDLFEYGIINIHPGLLPYGRGADPIIWGMLNNEPLGVTIHWIDEGIDTGNILYRTKVLPIGLETAEDIYYRVISSYKYLFGLFWTWFHKSLENGYIPTGEKQVITSGSSHKRKDLTKAGLIDYELKKQLLALSSTHYDNLYMVDDDGKKHKVTVTIGEE